MAPGPRTDAWARGQVLPALYCLLIGLAGLGTLSYALLTHAGNPPWLPILLFTFLSFLVQRSSFHFGSPAVHSLAGVIDVAAVLALGPVPGAMVAAGSGLGYLVLNSLRHRAFTRRRLLDVPLFNAGLKALAALAAGGLYQALDGPLPLTELGLRELGAALVVCLAWFLSDLVGWTVLDYLSSGREGVYLLAQDALRQALLAELVPLPFGIVVALGYACLTPLAFALMALAVVAAALLAQRWADARNELMRRVAELSTIDQVGRAIVQAQLDVDELCRLMYEHARQLVDTTIFHLGLFEGDTYNLQLWMREGQREPSRSFHLTPGMGLVGWLRESKQPILVGDFQKEMDSLPARPVYVSDTPPRSAIFVPLLAGDTAIGTLSIQSFRPYAYGKSDLRVLSAMANQAAVAIQKAQLYESQVRRARELETIGEVSRQLTATLELDELFERVVHLIRKNFGYYHVAIYTADPEREEIMFEASASASGQDVAVDVDWGEGLVGLAAAQREPLLVNNVTDDDRYRCIDALDETQSEITVPLLLEDELVGLLDVQSNQLNAFGPADLFILETLSDQIAIAIQEARLYDAERQQAWFSTALLQVADATSRLSDMDAVLSSIVRLTPLLAGVDRCAILLWDPDKEAFLPTQTYGLEPEARETFEHMVFDAGMLPALDLMRARRHPVLATAGDKDLLPRHLVDTFDIMELLVLPLSAHGELLGAMMVDYGGLDHPFTERMVTMLTGIANQAAMVIHNARLVQAQQEEAYVSTVLLQVAEAVSQSIELDQILSTIVRITPLLVGVEFCAVFLRDREGSQFVPAQQYGLGRALEADFDAMRLSAQDGFVSDLLVGQPFTTVTAGDGSDGQQTTPAALFRGQSVLALPLLAKAEVVGLMLVDYAGTEHHFTRRWLNILTGIAGQTAMAVENDRLLEEAAEQERTKQELNVGRRIQASFLPDCCPDLPGWELSSLWRSARQVGGDFYDFVPLPPAPASGESIAGDRLGLLVADVADKGVPAALYMALTRTLLRTVAIDGRSPARVLARTNDLILSDARSDMFVTAFYAILEPASGHVCYANAGHMPGLVMRAAGGEPIWLRQHGMALGVLPGQESPEASVSLEPGDTLILYTDGLVEASNAQKEMFGSERLIEVVQRHRAQPAGQLIQTIDDAIAAFAGEAAQFDDLTMIVARRKA